MLPVGPVGPGHRHLDLFAERSRGDLAGEAADAGGRDAAGGGDSFRRVLRVEISLGDQLEHRHGAAAVGERRLADDARLDIGTQRAAYPAVGFEHQRFARLVAGEQPVIGSARRLDHQPGGVGVAPEIGEIDLVGFQQLMDQRQHEQPVGAGADADPFVGDCRIPRAHRIDRDELGAAPPQPGQGELDRV